MKKAIVIAAVILSLFATAAYAYIDAQCMSDCLSRGYMYGYCQKVCSY
jgi:hypothetical protein